MDEPFVWNRPSTSSAVDDDPWDDTLLIQAYEEANRMVDRALDPTVVGTSKGKSVKVTNSRTSTGSKSVKVTNSRTSTGSGSPTVSSPKKSKISQNETSEQPNKWTVGQFCRCTYEEDGEEYEAKIISIHGNECLVQFVGYGNEEEKKLHQLSISNGEEARCKQLKEAGCEASTTATEPDPMCKCDLMSECDPVSRREPSEGTRTGSRFATSSVVPPGLSPPPCDEAMASMLMSWYMSGYHTGYYKAMQDLKGEKQTE